MVDQQLDIQVFRALHLNRLKDSFSVGNEFSNVAISVAESLEDNGLEFGKQLPGDMPADCPHRGRACTFGRASPKTISLFRGETVSVAFLGESLDHPAWDPKSSTSALIDLGWVVEEHSSTDSLHSGLASGRREELIDIAQEFAALLVHFGQRFAAGNHLPHRLKRPRHRGRGELE